MQYYASPSITIRRNCFPIQIGCLCYHDYLDCFNWMSIHYKDMIATLSIMTANQSRIFCLLLPY